MTFNFLPGAHPRKRGGAFADVFIENGKVVARNLKNTERTAEQRILQRQDANVRELARLDERCNPRRTQFETEILVGFALIGDDG